MKLEIKPFVLEANALLKKLELRPCNTVIFRVRADGVN